LPQCLDVKNILGSLHVITKCSHSHTHMFLCHQAVYQHLLVGR